MLVSSPVLAATSSSQGALTQGVAANLKQAQSTGDNKTVCLLVGAGVVIGGIILIASGNGHGAIGATTTCPFSGCPVPTTTTTATTTTTTTTTTTN